MSIIGEPHRIFRPPFLPEAVKKEDLNDHPFAITKSQLRELNNHPKRSYVAVSSWHQLRVFDGEMVYCYDTGGRQTLVLRRGRAAE